MRRQLIGIALTTLSASTTVLAGDYGSAGEAKAMLVKAVAAVEADEATALAMFTKGEGEFKDRDLYPYCVGPDGKFSAHPTLVGAAAADLKDKAGEPLGTKLLAAATANPDKIVEVSYVWTRPGETKAVEKIAFVTTIRDQICAVGFYK